jgi:hypothetical protein
MTPPSYLRRVATRQAATLGQVALAPQRILFRPILQHTGSLEAETAPLRSPITGRTPEADTAISAPLAMGAELPLPPVRPAQRQRRHPEPATPGRFGASPSVVARPHEQEILNSPGPTVARDLAAVPSPIHDAQMPNPELARNATGPIGFAAGRASPVSSPGRDRRPVFAEEQPASQAPRPSMLHDNRQEPRYSDAPREAAESETARGKRIQLTPPLNHARRETNNATAGPETARGGVHIGSLEVHVSAPPVTADSTQAPFVPQPGVDSGRARPPLVRGFPSFGLVQS